MKARLFAIGLALCFHTHSSIASEGIVVFIGSAGGYAIGTSGWSFEPLADISVTSLGCFDYIIGSQSPISVGLWAPDGSLLASSVVTGSSQLVNQTRYEPINPVLLSAGQTYEVGAYSSSGAIILASANPGDGGSVTTSSGIQFGGAVANFQGFGFPTPVENGAGVAFLTANFQYVTVPEPSSIALLLLCGGLIGWRKKL
jgi:hypothetical protein